jgi:alpha-glucosidase (family GH31 glycosyl hydrolase)
MEFSDDITCAKIDTQAFLGPAILVSPIFDETSTAINLYFPKARFHIF